MWTVIYITSSIKEAERIQDKLTEEGFLVKIRHADVAREHYEILVPEVELEEVRPFLGPILNA